MGKIHNAITTILSTVGLFVGLWGGYDIAGILGAITFAPVGAFVGCTIGMLHIRLLTLFS
ncbi:hypothetical protein GB928_015490 [Shinella curvata]|uniref:Uncharacterized protein n=1 Tax=Shinella curvata TaxID=1817964 RepID=A0ABT8XFR9_9HYPH|nr:hypothetical protein [Shinella curvata]MCJ8053263.1 hypothetical protein [Shinella curvata]MDO6122594.1 hypothetical protein [Shinella curvata]